MKKIHCFYFCILLSGFIWIKMELWLIPQKYMLLRNMWVCLRGALPVVLGPSSRNTRCTPFPTIQAQTCSLCTVIHDLLARAPLTFWQSSTQTQICRYSKTTLVTQRKGEMIIVSVLNTALIGNSWANPPSWFYLWPQPPTLIHTYIVQLWARCCSSGFWLLTDN